MSSYLSMPVVPTVLGFDPRIQFIHEDDLVESIRLSVLEPTAGTYNVAGDGVLLLSQAIRRLGRRQVIVPRPLFPVVARRLVGRGIADFSSESVRYLTYGRSLDTRAMRETLGFEPDWTTAQALESFVESRSHVA
jgi:UDP-glucose 4-epimerase